MSSVRFTFVYDRFNRTAVASLVAALEDVVEDPHACIRAVRSNELEDVEFGLSVGISEILCFSTMTANAAKAIDIHRMLRRKWGGAFTSICGGSHAAGDPRSLLGAGMDYCCVGEGEDVIREIHRHAAGGESLESIMGLLRLEGGELRGERAIRPVEIERYSALPVRVQFPTYIEIGRVCRWMCLYCQTPQVHGRKERYRRPGRVEEVVRRYAGFGMRDFRFLLPNTLGYMSEKCGVPNCAALEELLARSSKACGGGRIFLGSFPSEVRPDYVTEPALRVLKAHVSNTGLVIGGQSGSGSVLDAVKRGHGIGAIRRACDISLACGFEPSVDLVPGFPGETAEDRAATLDLVEHLGTIGAFTNMHFFMPLPGTALAGALPVFLSDGVRRRLDRFAPAGYIERQVASPGETLEKVGVPVMRLKPLPVKLFCGLIGSEDRFAEALLCLELEFGPVDFGSRPAPFDFTDYYRDEMGPDLTRKWIAFTGLKERAYLALAKHIAVGIEERLARHGSRTVNIDPGYVDDAQVVLSTAKNFAHRIYIGMGYDAEPALIYVKGRFRPLEWTYPDYKSPAAIEFFKRARTSYHGEFR